MKIIDRLNLIIKISFISAIILSIVVSINLNMLIKENRVNKLSHEIYEGVTELEIIKFEYLLHHEKRMREQWGLKYKSVMDLIDTIEKEESIKSIEADLVALGNKFSQVIENYEKKQKLIHEGASEKEINSAQLIEDISVDQLLIKSQSIFSKCASLAENILNRTVRDNKLSIIITFFITIIFILSIIILSFLVSKSISKPLCKLKQGIEIISKGNLEHQIEVVSQDELGDFASAFNQAIVSLKEATASRDELNREIAERKKLEEKLKKLAHFDALTGCYSRGYGLSLLEQQIKNAKRKKTPILLLYLDVDNFKYINDTFGHQEGDKVLKEAVKLFKSTLREVDIICRLGGDEFLLIFPEGSLKDVPLIRERINKNLKKLNQKMNKPFKIDFSVGIACYDQSDPLSLEELIHRADQKMYEDKKKKKNEN